MYYWLREEIRVGTSSYAYVGLATASKYISEILKSYSPSHLESANTRLDELAITSANLPPTLEESGILDDSLYVLEDEG